MTTRVKRAALSWLLVFTMMVGLMQMIGGNVYAYDDHELFFHTKKISTEYVAINKESKIVSIAIKDPDLKTSYLVNQFQVTFDGSEFATDYSFGVTITDGSDDFRIATEHFFDYDNPAQELKVLDFDSHISKEENNAYSHFDSVELEVYDGCFEWTFKLPDNFDLSKMRITNRWIHILNNYYGSSDSVYPTQFSGIVPPISDTYSDDIAVKIVVSSAEKESEHLVLEIDVKNPDVLSNVNKFNVILAHYDDNGKMIGVEYLTGKQIDTGYEYVGHISENEDRLIILDAEQEPVIEAVKIYTVLFDSNGGGEVESQNVNENGTVAIPSAPTKDGYVFAGWYTDSELTSEYDFEKSVTGNLKLYAHWTKKPTGGGGSAGNSDYTVTFETNGGSDVDEQKVRSNWKVVKPATPTKDGSNFAGWFCDSELTEAYDFKTRVTADLTLYAKWKKMEPGNITDSWEQIIASTEDGTYKSKYQIGDTKALDLGSEGIVEMQIAAFDADEKADGSGTAAITWISKQLLNSEYQMNPGLEYNPSTDTYTLAVGTGSIGGWKESEMRSWLNSSIKPIIPSKVRASIKQVKKYSISGDTSNNKVENELTYDDVWIPSSREIFGHEETQGPTYTSLFATDNDRIKEHFDSQDSERGSWWWLRSACKYGGNYIAFNLVSFDGFYGLSDSPYSEMGVALGFCL